MHPIKISKQKRERKREARMKLYSQFCLEHCMLLTVSSVEVKNLKADI